MMNCKEATRLLSEKRDRDLSVKEKSSLKFHTMMCSACRNFDKQLAAISVFSQSYIKGKGKDKKDSQQYTKFFGAFKITNRLSTDSKPMQKNTLMYLDDLFIMFLFDSLN